MPILNLDSTEAKRHIARKSPRCAQKLTLYAASTPSSRTSWRPRARLAIATSARSVNWRRRIALLSWGSRLGTGKSMCSRPASICSTALKHLARIVGRRSTTGRASAISTRTKTRR